MLDDAQQFHPPSMLTQFPVMKLDSSLNKNAIKYATSSGLPILPSGTEVAPPGLGPLSEFSAIAAATIGVSMYPLSLNQ